MGRGPPSGYHGQQNLGNTGPPSDFHKYQQQSPQQADRQPSERQPQSVGVEQEEPVDSWEDMVDSGPLDGRQEEKDSPAESREGTVEEMNQTSEQPESVVSVAEDKMDTAKEDGADSREEPSAVKLAETRQAKPGRSEQREKKDTSRMQQAEPTKVKVVPQLPIHDDKENLNIIFIGHVDAGKSTIGGQLMYVVHCGLSPKWCMWCIVVCPLSGGVL